MKKAVLMSALGLLASWPAMAADIPIRAPINKAPVIQDYGNPWDGFYIGGAAGYGRNNGEGTGTGTTILGSSSTAFSTSPQGFVGGLHAGLGGHLAPGWYIGGEVAAGVGTLSGTAQNPGFIGSIDSKNNALFSVAGRFGYNLTPSTLLYVKGGWAWANSEFTIIGTDGSRFTTKPTINGALAGFGAEYALTRNWIAGLEYQHYFLSDMAMSTTGVVLNTGLPVALSGKVDNHIDTVLARLSYKF
jgi:outer membrane immunogenic protein